MNALLLLVVAGSSQAALAAPIDTVVVFADRAEVTRVAAASCPANEALRLTFPLLPPGLDTRTLRAEARAPAKAVGVSARLITLEAPPDEDVASIRGELQEIERARVELDHRRSNARERLSTVDAYGSYLQGLLREEARSEQPRLAMWTEALDLLGSERLRAAREQLEIDREGSELDGRAQLLERRLAARVSPLGQQGEKRGYEVIVTVDCERSHETTVRLSYVVSGASWTPEYDLRFESADKDGVGPGQVSIEFAAVVRQATGEDWRDAALRLSTSRPRLGAVAPQPAVIYVDGAEVGRQRVLVQEQEDRRSIPDGRALADVAAPRVRAALQDDGRAFTMTIPGRVDVRADARPYRVPVDELRASAVGQRVAVPKLSVHAYRVASFSNPAAYPLLEGTAHVYRDGSYAGRLALEYAAPGAPLEVSLGPDETVRIRRHELFETDRSPGLLQRSRRMERAYRMEMENVGDGAVTVQVRENIPVSRVEDVRVTLKTDKTTPGYTLDPGRGILQWEVVVPRSGRAEIDIAFTVSLPDHWDLASAG